MTSALPFLSRFARRLPTAERCELCSAELAPVHQHLLDPIKRQIVCSCDGCAVLFCGQAGRITSAYRGAFARFRTSKWPTCNGNR